MVTLALVWCALCALIAHKLAHSHGHDHGRKAEKRILARTKLQGRLLLFLVGCVCPMGVLYMPLRALYNPNSPKWPLIGLPDLAGDLAPNIEASYTTLLFKLHGTCTYMCMYGDTEVASDSE